MRHLYDIKDSQGQNLRVNLNAGEITFRTNNEMVIIEQKEMREIENRIQKMLQRYVPKAVEEAKEKGDIK